MALCHLAASLGTGLQCPFVAPKVTQPRLRVPGEGRTLPRLPAEQPSGARDDAPASRSSSHPAHVFRRRVPSRDITGGVRRVREELAVPLGSGRRVADSRGSAPGSGSGEPSGAAAPETESGGGSPQSQPPAPGLESHWFSLLFLPRSGPALRHHPEGPAWLRLHRQRGPCRPGAVGAAR